MNKTRRSLILALPAAPLMSLTACMDVADTDSDALVPRAQAQGLKPANGLGLRVKGTLLKLPDAIFKAGTNLEYIVPDVTVIQGCLSSGTLWVTLLEYVGNYHRSIALKLPSPAVGKVYNIATTPSGDAVVVVNDATAIAVKHYDYLLNKGTIKVSAMTDADGDRAVTLVFAGVVGAPTPTGVAPSNAATRVLQLDGTVKVSYVKESVSALA
jgi:hypothetical protein